MRTPQVAVRFVIGFALAIGDAGSAHAASDGQRLTLLHTSDLHGQVLPYDDIRGTSARGSLAQIVTLVDEVRREVVEQVPHLAPMDALQAQVRALGQGAHRISPPV